MNAETYWNHNVHYHPLVLAAVPEGCGAALDIGCGDGLLTRKLSALAKTATGVDRHTEMITTARARSTDFPTTTFAEADFLDPAHDLLAEGTYDFVSAVAVVHHVDFEQAVRAMQRLLAPGGRLVIVGLANNRTWLDWLISGAGVPANRILRRLRNESEPAGMRIESPGMDWQQIRTESQRLLPGRRYRRHLLWRYSLVWEKPGT
ncbi:class I SAM-dependent methyltransferase [Streptomyces sp. NBC_01465]|uniref:class I SAM-dependent methyltransferase n=1 Tax=Streptomyces sp. NBC_01465 TaxID=2903878 RepID=UPI002E3783EC|nr:class I SAM-dependent methyltransferase [Streptomyces sp. NBC_01465]